MVNKQKSIYWESAPPPLDEDWWDSLLSEEENWGGELLKQQPEKLKPASHENDQVDWGQVLFLFENDEIILARVCGYNQGGLLVENEMLHGFVPISHLVDINPEELQNDNPNHLASTNQYDALKSALSAYVGESISLKVIECDPARGRIVLSERAAQAAPGRRNQLLNRLQCGEQVWGTVTNITEFGVFVDLGGLEGLIHISELSWGRVRHPADVLKLGEKVKVHVIQADRERCRIALSLKRLFSNPWETAEERYQIGQIITATVTSIVSYGAFARIEEGLDGLIHSSEMSIDGKQVSPEQLVQEGEPIKARIVHIDASKQRLGLSLILDQE